MPPPRRDAPAVPDVRRQRLSPQPAGALCIVQCGDARDVRRLCRHGERMGGQKTLLFHLPQFHARAQHPAGQRGEGNGQQKHPAVREHRRIPFGRADKEVRAEILPCGARLPRAGSRKQGCVAALPRRLTKLCRIMPFAAHLVREQKMLLRERKFGMAGEEGADLPLVLPLLERAGRIDERSAAREHGGGILQDGALTGDAAFDVLLAPFGDGVRVLAEHPLARAGRVDQDLIEIGGQRRGERGCLRGQDGAVCDAHALDVLREDAGAVIDVLVGDEHALSPHRRRELRRLSARRGAQIEHPLPAPDAEQGRGAHCGGLLRVEQPRVMRGMGARLCERRIKSPFRPRDGLRQGQEPRERGGVRLQQIGAHAAHGRRVERTQKGGEPLSQPFLHPR